MYIADSASVEEGRRKHATFLMENTTFCVFVGMHVIKHGFKTFYEEMEVSIAV